VGGSLFVAALALLARQRKQQQQQQVGKGNGEPLLTAAERRSNSGGGSAVAPSSSASAGAADGAVVLGIGATGPPPLVVLLGQRSADLRAVCRALQGAGIEAAAAGQSSATFAELAMSDAELVHPERDARLAALLRSGRLRGAGGSGSGGGGGACAGRAGACVVLACDRAGERVPLVGRYGKLEKLHAALLSAGVPAQRIAFVGTREARPEPHVFAPDGQLTPGFVQRLGDAQLATLQRERYVPSRFMVWGNEATVAQSATLRAWLGGMSAGLAMLHELEDREESALENMASNMRDIKAAAVAAKMQQASGEQDKKKKTKTKTAAPKPKTQRAQTVQWAAGV
jgi:hypothetical protein